MLEGLKPGANVASFLEQQLLRVIRGQHSRHDHLAPLSAQSVDPAQERLGRTVGETLRAKQLAAQIEDWVFGLGSGLKKRDAGMETPVFLRHPGFMSAHRIELLRCPGRFVNRIVRVILSKRRLEQFHPLDGIGCVELANQHT
ncbi:MAG: hypothetical protein E6L09_13180 [Verrucomicrobia bacterium]|nr:MAG: hypothetical protein E6L09_13180 [Verrucomicrobiota bacterium]